MSINFHGGNELIDARKLLTRAGIKQGDIVGELACGATGHFVFPAAHMVGSTGRVYAVDIIKSVLEAVRSRAKLEGVDNVETVWGDLERFQGMKIADGSVDLAVLVNDLSQIPKKEIVLQEAARITKSGGTLLVGDWKQTASPLGPPPEKRLTPAIVRQLAQEAGFEYSEEFEAGPYHFGLIFHKK
ncbi:MAG: methyltransferase domain-containing protein [bacterium]|nr:methyltransferase domain-containing protein [bacterium]